MDFKRDPGLTLVLTGSSKWDQANVNPLDNLQDWAQTVLQQSGAIPLDVVMTVDVWKVFRKHPDVLTRLNRLRGDSTMTQAAQITESAVSMGQIDGFNVFVYAGWFIDDDSGNEKPILPPGTVLMGSQGIKGVRAFGAIRDEEAGFQAMPYYPKSWVEKDPSVRYLMMQSAPLVVPSRVNASFCATVL